MFLLLGSSLLAQDWRGSFSCDSAEIQASGVVVDGDFIYSLGSFTDTLLHKTYDIALFKINQITKVGQVYCYELSRWMRPRWGIKQAPDGNLLLLAAGAYDYCVLKVDTSGNFLWGKWFETPYPYVSQIEVSADGKIFLAGDDESANSISNGFLLSLDSYGNLLQYNNFNSPFQWNAQTHTGAILATSDGGLLYTASMGLGYPNSAMYFAKFDNALKIVWQRAVGIGDPVAYSLVEDDSSYYYAGTHFGEDRGLLIGKLNNIGLPLWQKVYATGWTLRPSMILKNNKLHVTSFTAPWSSQIFPRKQLVASFNLNGQVISSGLLPDSSTSAAEHMNFASHADKLFLLRSFTGKGIFITNTEEFNLSCKDSLQLPAPAQPLMTYNTINALGKLNSITNGNVTATLSVNRPLRYTNPNDCLPTVITTTHPHALPSHVLSVYPNPGSGKIILELAEATGTYSMKILDVSGRVMLVKDLDFSSASKNTIEINGEGLFILQLQNGQDNFVQKIVMTAN